MQQLVILVLAVTVASVPLPFTRGIRPVFYSAGFQPGQVSAWRVDDDFDDDDRVVFVNPQRTSAVQTYSANAHSGQYVVAVDRDDNSREIVFIPDQTAGAQAPSGTGAQTYSADTQSGRYVVGIDADDGSSELVFVPRQTQTAYQQQTAATSHSVAGPTVQVYSGHAEQVDLQTQTADQHQAAAAPLGADAPTAQAYSGHTLQKHTPAAQQAHYAFVASNEIDDDDVFYARRTYQQPSFRSASPSRYFFYDDRRR